MAGAGGYGIRPPDGALYFPDMGFAQIEHTDSGLADAAADGIGQFPVQQCLLEGQAGPFFTSGQL